MPTTTLLSSVTLLAPELWWSTCFDVLDVPGGMVTRSEHVLADRPAPPAAEPAPAVSPS